MSLRVNELLQKKGLIWNSYGIFMESFCMLNTQLTDAHLFWGITKNCSFIIYLIWLNRNDHFFSGRLDAFL